MSIHKSKGLEFPVVFLSSAGSGFNMMDLNNDILLHQKIGIGVKYIDYDRQIKYDTISKLALKEKLLEENLSEEMRILYVALTRAKEKIYVTAIKKDFNKNKEKMQELVDIYKKENGKINPILVKKYKKYIDWILLVYMYNFESSKDIFNLNILNRKDVLKKEKTEELSNINIFGILEECSKDVKNEDILKLKEQLEFEYKYRELRDIPTKESVTNIVHKNITVDSFEKSEENQEANENLEITFHKPKFLVGTEEEKITPAKKGTLVHLCMKNLDFHRDYSLNDVKNLIDDLVKRQIITLVEKDAINPWDIFNFTRSDIWEELKSAKEYRKEEAFYINVPAKDIIQTDLEENILTQGIIDLYYITKDDKLVLLDYKTDFFDVKKISPDEAESTLINRHRPQLMLYKDALENGLNRKVDMVWIYSTAMGKEIFVE